MPRMPAGGRKQTPYHTMSGTNNPNKWEQAINQLDQWLLSSKTEPRNCQEIIHGLNRWYNKENPTTEVPTSAAAMEQDLLGWDLALEGCISKNGVSNKSRIGKQPRHTNLAEDGQQN